MKPGDYLGDATLEKMKKTKWYALAQMLEDLLYNSSVQPDAKYPTTRRFVTTEKAYVGNSVPSWVIILGHEGTHIDTAKGLRELVHECERMAIKEVT